MAPPPGGSDPKAGSKDEHLALLVWVVVFGGGDLAVLGDAERHRARARELLQGAARPVGRQHARGRALVVEGGGVHELALHLVAGIAAIDVILGVGRRLDAVGQTLLHILAIQRMRGYQHQGADDHHAYQDGQAELLHAPVALDGAPCGASPARALRRRKAERPWNTAEATSRITGQITKFFWFAG